MARGSLKPLNRPGGRFRCAFPILGALNWDLMGLLMRVSDDRGLLMGKSLKISTMRRAFKNKYHLLISWDGMVGRREMVIDVDQNEINIPREGVEDIYRLCDEFLNDRDFSHSYLTISK